MSSDPLFDSLEAVRDEATLLRFVEALAADRKAADRLSATLDGHQAE
ncbi:hypothetical protein [Marilutibacter alkalisoli]|nr:hypothetical protein [Lysobacter alkalisoli]